MVNGERVDERHLVGNTGNQLLGIKKRKLNSFGDNIFGGGSRWGARGPLNRKPST